MTEVLLLDPNGQLRYQVNQLLNGYCRENGIDADLSAKVWQCRNIFGLTT